MAYSVRTCSLGGGLQRVYQTGNVLHFQMWRPGFCPTSQRVPIRMVLNGYMSPNRYNFQCTHTLTPTHDLSPHPPHTHTQEKCPKINQLLILESLVVLHCLMFEKVHIYYNCIIRKHFSLSLV